MGNNDLFEPASRSNGRGTITPLKQWLVRFKYLINKQNESRELLSLFSLPCWLREKRLSKFISKEFMSDERKKQNEKINCSVYRGKQTNANEMKRKRRNLANKTRLTASDEIGNWGGITVYSIKYTKSSC